MLIKEGATTDFTYKEDLAKLLRFESTALEPGKLTGLDDYLERMTKDQEEVLFLFGKSRESIEAGPYLEALKARGLEVLLCTEAVDEYVMQTIREYKEKKIVSADSDEVKLEKLDQEDKGESLNKKDTKSLCKWLKKTLDDKVSEVETGDRLIDSPVCVVGADGMGGACSQGDENDARSRRRNGWDAYSIYKIADQPKKLHYSGTFQLKGKRRTNSYSCSESIAR